MTGQSIIEEILEAERLHDAWYKNEAAKTREPEEELRFQFDTTMLYVEAGFRDQAYLDEVANDWLTQDAEAAETQGFSELAAQIRTKIDDINQRLEINRF